MPSTLYVGLGVFEFQGRPGGVFKSTDGGATWHQSNTGLTNPDVRALTIDPQTPDTLYAVIDGGGVFKSTDGGASWSPSNTGLTSPSVESLAIDPVTPSTLYAGTNVGVFKSTDGGASWSPSNTGLTNLTVGVAAINPATPSTLYAGTRGGGVFKSTDGGASWNPSNTGLASLIIRALAIDPQTPDTLYAVIDGGGVFKSTDGGADWSPSNPGLPIPLDVQALAIDPGASSTLYAVIREGGIFKSTDGGASWSPSNSGLTNLTVGIVAIDPVVPSMLYAGTVVGLFKSTDGGASWNPSNAGLAGLNVKVVAIDPETPTTLYAGTVVGVFKSTDSGTTWSPSNTGLPGPDLDLLGIRALVIDPVTPGTLYAGTVAGVFKSTDGGASWSSSNTGLTISDVRALALDPVTPSTLYAGTGSNTGGDGVFKSTDGGASWNPTAGPQGRNIEVLAIDPVTASTLYAGTDQDGLFKTTDGGASWSPSNIGLTNPTLDFLGIRALAIDPLTPSTLYAGIVHDGVYKSMDGGANWSRSSTGLTSLDMWALVIDPVTPSTLYAGTGFPTAEGVFRSTDGGTTWHQSNTGLTNPDVRALAIDPLTPTLRYAGTAGRSVFAFQEVPTVTIAATDPTATEAGLTTGQFTVSRTEPTAAALTVFYTVGGTATAGSDYAALAESVTIPAGMASVVIVVTPIADDLVEPDESVVATLSSHPTYAVGVPGSAIVTIASQDVPPSPVSTVAIAATDPTATEAGLTTGQFTVSRTEPTAAALTVFYTVGGMATAGSDYGALPGSVTVPPGAASATVLVTPSDDTAVEPDETVVMTLSADPAYLVGVPGSATVTITSDDVPPAPVPDIDVQPTSWDYGAIPVGIASAKAFTVTNTGLATLNVTGTSLVGSVHGQFAIVNGGGAFSLAAGQSRQVTIQFVPTSAGVTSATFRLTSNDPDENPKDVPVNGTGNPAPTLLVSPPTGHAASPQVVDLGLFATALHQTVTDLTARHNGRDVTALLNDCLTRGTLASGGQTFRCPDVPMAFLGPGTHTLDFTAFFTGGLSASATVTWSVDDTPRGLTIFPPTGHYVLTQFFDLAILVNHRGRAIVGGRAVLNGVDVTTGLAACVTATPLGDGSIALVCPGLPAALLGPGVSTLEVTLRFDDGSSTDQSVDWSVHTNTEP
jgi:photosystem II stability/assembly factor-like uncharacterized protein